jgi:hypothetical protein
MNCAYLATDETDETEIFWKRLKPLDPIIVPSVLVYCQFPLKFLQIRQLTSISGLLWIPARSSTGNAVVAIATSEQLTQRVFIWSSEEIAFFFAGSNSATIKSYLALDHPLEQICRSLPNDPVMRRRVIFVEACESFDSLIGNVRHVYHFIDETSGSQSVRFSLTLRKRYGKRRR